MSNERTDVPAVGAGKTEKRAPHSIRFFDLEWARIEAFAEQRGLAPAEFVRFTALTALAEGSGRPGARLDPIIERTFRYAYMMATRMRDEMLAAGRGEEVEVLIGEARSLQDELLNDVPGSG